MNHKLRNTLDSLNIFKEVAIFIIAVLVLPTLFWVVVLRDNFEATFTKVNFITMVLAAFGGCFLLLGFRLRRSGPLSDPQRDTMQFYFCLGSALLGVAVVLLIAVTNMAGVLLLIVTNVMVTGVLFVIYDSIPAFRDWGQQKIRQNAEKR